jgi:hypothetical protein
MDRNRLSRKIPAAGEIIAQTRIVREGWYRFAVLGRLL